MSLARRLYDRVSDFWKTYMTGNTRDGGEVPAATFARALLNPRTNEVAFRINDYGQYVVPKRVTDIEYDALPGDDCLIFEATAFGCTCNLINPNSLPGKAVEIKNNINSLGSVVVRVKGDNGTIDGDEVTLPAGGCVTVRASVLIYGQYEIISRYTPA